MSNKKSINDLLFEAKLSSLYHAALERKYSMFINITSVGTLLLTSLSFVTLLDLLPMEWKTLIVSISSFSVVLLNSVVLGCGYNEKSKMHSEMRKKWIQIEMSLYESMYNDKSLATDVLLNASYKLHSQEPALKTWYVHKAFNQTIECLGRDKSAKIPLMETLAEVFIVFRIFKKSN
ncbi:hypothetical protein [Maridesulfovibrio sp. FT414]|uniref:hypothetical protein n=1 Tax=Maridesulfovibrio sp. FT414 TaxID=2979469 RepID=UPI003D8074B1